MYIDETAVPVTNTSTHDIQWSWVNGGSVHDYGRDIARLQYRRILVTYQTCRLSAFGCTLTGLAGIIAPQLFMQFDSSPCCAHSIRSIESYRRSWIYWRWLEILWLLPVPECTSCGRGYQHSMCSKLPLALDELRLPGAIGICGGVTCNTWLFKFELQNIWQQNFGALDECLLRLRDANGWSPNRFQPAEVNKWLSIPLIRMRYIQLLPRADKVTVFLNGELISPIQSLMVDFIVWLF